MSVLPWAVGSISGSRRRGAVVLAALIALGPGAPRPAAAAPVFEILYDFASGAVAGADGYYPRAGLVLDKAGALYGTDSDGGGPSFSGVVFRLAPAVAGRTRRVETVLHSFNGKSDGGIPLAGLVLDRAGALYGTTSTDGGALHQGVVFRLAPAAAGKAARAETVLHAFTGGQDGGFPLAGLVMDGSGALYGTTADGGADNWGAVFRLTPPVAPGTAWTLTTLYSFTGDRDGQSPRAGLIRDKAGALYGTAEAGGAYEAGVVFKLTPPAAAKAPWTETVLYNFRRVNGENPVTRLLMDQAGALYGTTEGGGASDRGVAFRLAPPATSGGAWTETVLHSFSLGSGGGTPYAGLTMDKAGALYGTTWQGGTHRFGVVYKLTPPAAGKQAWPETVLHNFAGGADGEQPYGDLVMDPAGALYGTTRAGGTGGAGIVYKLTP